jgi:hypothetical protein
MRYKMIIIYENKGILMPVYFILSFFGSAFLAGELKRRFNIDVSFTVVSSFACLISGILACLFCDDYYKRKDGKKELLDNVNSFFFIKMKYWGYGLIVLGIIGMLFGKIEFIK